MLRILFIGCGDIALRTARLLPACTRLYGLIRRPETAPALQAAGITPILGDLDHRMLRVHLRTAPFAVVHLVSPGAEGNEDRRTRRLLAALSRAAVLPLRYVYVSTTGVYGDCHGQRVNETHPRMAHIARGRRRVDAENVLRQWAVRHRVRLSVLRVAAIYDAARLPLDSIRRGMPVLLPEHDVYISRIHADDLARTLWAALFRGRPNRAYNVADNAELKMGAYFEMLAETFALPPPLRVSWEEAERTMAPALLAFMSESRRLDTRRLCEELRVVLRYPDPQTFLAEWRGKSAPGQLPLPL
ncbi:MAG: SDR family NAD(P)-dependent oxidoreductase [Burkholderiales bacterium]|jgi:nucleoside-diphosphate-sugar epimerase|nr:SDR family NAD(P)-dependent oxidoreductase [Burkholderiales bacterium]